MKKLSILASTAFLIASYSTAQAEPIWSGDSLGLIKYASINIEDDVTGNCWTNMGSIIQNARLKLEQSDVNVYSEPLSSTNPFAYNIDIYANGFRHNSNTCVGSLALVISKLGYTTFDSQLEIGGTTLIFQRGNVAAGPTLNEMFFSSVDSYITELSAEIISQRRNPTISTTIIRNQTDYNGKPETVEEQRKKMEELRRRLSQ